jgi:hypothetical protein
MGGRGQLDRKPQANGHHSEQTNPHELTPDHPPAAMGSWNRHPDHPYAIGIRRAMVCLALKRPIVCPQNNSCKPRLTVPELRFLVADALLSPSKLRLGAPGEKPRSRGPQNHHPRMDEASQRQTRFKRTGAVICDPSCRTARAKGARRFGRADRELVRVAHRQELTAAASGRRYQPRKQQPLSRCSKLPTRPHHL